MAKNEWGLKELGFSTHVPDFEHPAPDFWGTIPVHASLDDIMD